MTKKSAYAAHVGNRRDASTEGLAGMDELATLLGRVALRDRRLAFHVGEEPPRVSRFLIEQD